MQAATAVVGAGSLRRCVPNLPLLPPLAASALASAGQESWRWPSPPHRFAAARSKGPEQRTGSSRGHMLPPRRSGTPGGTVPTSPWVTSLLALGLAIGLTEKGSFWWARRRPWLSRGVRGIGGPHGAHLPTAGKYGSPGNFEPQARPLYGEFFLGIAIGVVEPWPTCGGEVPLELVIEIGGWAAGGGSQSSRLVGCR